MPFASKGNLNTGLMNPVWAVNAVLTEKSCNWLLWLMIGNKKFRFHVQKLNIWKPELRSRS